MPTQGTYEPDSGNIAADKDQWMDALLERAADAIFDGYIAKKSKSNIPTRVDDSRVDSKV